MKGVKQHPEDKIKLSHKQLQRTKLKVSRYQMPKGLTVGHKMRAR
jgi:hypothetical protein